MTAEPEHGTNVPSGYQGGEPSMSILGSIMEKVFHHAAAAPAASTPVSAPSPAASAPASSGETVVNPAATASPTPAQSAPVDVGAVLEAMAAQKGGGGNYQKSIVDLLKLLDLDSSLDARKQLAQELDVHAGADGSAEQNMALHKAVVQKLADNGGKIPDSMKA